MYNLLLENNTIGKLIKAAMTEWFLTIHKTAAIDYSEYNQETWKVLFQDKMDHNYIGTKSQEAIMEGLLDLSILDTLPEIKRRSMTRGRSYDRKNKDMPRGSMNTESWHGRNMGLKDEPRARASTKRGNENNVPTKGSNTTAGGNTCINAEDANTG